MPQPTMFDAYIDAAPPPSQATLRELQSFILEAVRGGSPGPSAGSSSLMASGSVPYRRLSPDAHEEHPVGPVRGTNVATAEQVAEDLDTYVLVAPRVAREERPDIVLIDPGPSAPALMRYAARIRIGGGRRCRSGTTTTGTIRRAVATSRFSKGARSRSVTRSGHRLGSLPSAVARPCLRRGAAARIGRSFALAGTMPSGPGRPPSSPRRLQYLGFR